MRLNESEQDYINWLSKYNLNDETVDKIKNKYTKLYDELFHNPDNLSNNKDKWILFKVESNSFKDLFDDPSKISFISDEFTLDNFKLEKEDPNNPVYSADKTATTDIIGRDGKTVMQKNGELRRAKNLSLSTLRSQLTDKYIKWTKEPETYSYYVKITRDIKELTHMSTDKQWESCQQIQDFQEYGYNHYVFDSIENGLLIAYAYRLNNDEDINKIDKSDKQYAEDAIARISINPFNTADNKFLCLKAMKTYAPHWFHNQQPFNLQVVVQEYLNKHYNHDVLELDDVFYANNNFYSDDKMSSFNPKTGDVSYDQKNIDNNTYNKFGNKNPDDLSLAEWKALYARDSRVIRHMNFNNYTTKEEILDIFELFPYAVAYFPFSNLSTNTLIAILKVKPEIGKYIKYGFLNSDKIISLIKNDKSIIKYIDFSEINNNEIDIIVDAFINNIFDIINPVYLSTNQIIKVINHNKNKAVKWIIDSYNNDGFSFYEKRVVSAIICNYDKSYLPQLEKFLSKISFGDWEDLFKSDKSYYKLYANNIDLKYYTYTYLDDIIKKYPDLFELLYKNNNLECLSSKDVPSYIVVSLVEWISYAKEVIEKYKILEHIDIYSIINSFYHCAKEYVHIIADIIIDKKLYDGYSYDNIALLAVIDPRFIQFVDKKAWIKVSKMTINKLYINYPNSKDYIEKCINKFSETQYNMLDESLLDHDFNKFTRAFKKNPYDAYLYENHQLVNQCIELGYDDFIDYIANTSYHLDLFLDIKSKTGDYLIFYSVLCNQPKILKIIIDNINDGYNSLYLPNEVDYIFNEQNKDNQTALMVAIQAKDQSMIDTLISYKGFIDLKLKDDDGNTLLHYACYENNQNLITKLYSMGADFNVKNNDDKKPIELITDNNLKDYVDILLGLDNEKI